jgi:hypothetical protein
VAAVALVAGTAVVACLELSGPQSGLSSISTIEIAWPSVVERDVLRDSTGAPAPLRVEAFDGDGNLVSDATVLFVPLEPGLHVDAAGIVHGDSVRTSPVRVVAQVQRGGEVIQTPEVPIHVVPRPDTVSPAGSHTLTPKRHTLAGIADTSWITSDALNVTVQNKARIASTPNSAAVRAWIIRYEITSRPTAVEGAVSAFFAGGGNRQVAVDTTDANGVAGPQVVLRTVVLPPGSKIGAHEVKVTATIRERGQNVPGSPIEFVVPFEIRDAP